MYTGMKGAKKEISPRASASLRDLIGLPLRASAVKAFDREVREVSAKIAKFEYRPATHSLHAPQRLQRRVDASSR